MSLVETPLALARRTVTLLNSIPYSVVILPARIATFSVFFRSGLVKIADWNATIQLFREEYKVPVLPPELAAHMAAAMELGLSSLVLVGLFSRLSVLGLLGMVCVIQLFVEPMGWPDHIQWLGFMVFILWRGPGALSVDYLLALGRDSRPRQTRRSGWVAVKGDGVTPSQRSARTAINPKRGKRSVCGAKCV